MAKSIEKFAGMCLLRKSSRLSYQNTLTNPRDLVRLLGLGRLWRSC